MKRDHTDTRKMVTQWPPYQESAREKKDQPEGDSLVDFVCNSKIGYS